MPSRRAPSRDNEFNYVVTVTNDGLIPSDGVRARITLNNLVTNPDPHASNNSASAEVTINNPAPPSSGGGGGGGGGSGGTIEYLALPREQRSRRWCR